MLECLFVSATRPLADLTQGHVLELNCRIKEPGQSATLPRQLCLCPAESSMEGARAGERLLRFTLIPRLKSLLPGVGRGALETDETDERDRSIAAIEAYVERRMEEARREQRRRDLVAARHEAETWER